jgi:hypothetical protein
MLLDRLRQPPFNNTLLGVLRGVLDYYSIEVSRPMLYGLSGQAFFMNIHEALCPSGPYCWNYEPVFRLVHNLGIEMIDLGFFSRQSTPQERAAIETQLRHSLGRGIPCSLLNMEHQLLAGTDESGFLAAQPWSPHDSPPGHLTFGSWAEFGGEFHVDFFTFARTVPANPRQAAVDALDYALDVHRNPGHHTDKPYAAGPEAYTNWIHAVRNGHGASHGSWWNATVWAECRDMASKFCEEIGRTYPHVVAPAARLAAGYAEIAAGLASAGDKGMESDAKIGLLEDLQVRERRCIAGVAALAAALRAA